MSIINTNSWQEVGASWQRTGEPDHVIIDNFFNTDVLEQLLLEFPDYNSDLWTCNYDSPLENKKVCNFWDRFSPGFYQTFTFLLSKEFVNLIETIAGIKGLIPDVGLHGGGLHAHQRGGKLNLHRDYNLHPKLKLWRRLNLIVYLNPSWDQRWGGYLEFWNHDPDTNFPSKMVTKIEPRCNRAVLFDTSQNFWHGLPDELQCPAHVTRQSLAVYYLTDHSETNDCRFRALFAPSDSQKQDHKILEIIKQRTQL